MKPASTDSSSPTIPPERIKKFNRGNRFFKLGIILFVSSFPVGIIFGLLSMLFESQLLFGLVMVLNGMMSFGGIVMLIYGLYLRNTGEKGMAGSGVELDPERARDELKPISRMKGGILNDILEEANLKKHFGERDGQEIIRIRCQSCKALNDETAKFCNQCGKAL